MAAKTLDHIGMVVRDIHQTASRIKSILGFSIAQSEDYSQGLLSIAFIPLGSGLNGPKLELLQPNRPGSSAWDFLQSQGEGVEHVAFLVDDVDQELGVLQGQVPLLDHHSKRGAGHMNIAFLGRDAIPGLFTELVAPVRIGGGRP